MTTRAVDLFAGWGGFTEGATQAGVNVVWAANHWPLAVEAHAVNHPRTVHSCQDLRQADWSRLPAYDLLLAAPACQGHSEASQPKRRAYHDEMRATAWAVIDCADVTEPRAIVIENVPAFLRWRLYPAFKEALTRLNFTVTENIVRASYLGVPQRRDRLILTCTRGRAVKLDVPIVPEPAFEPCIEWDAPGMRSVDVMRGEDARTRLAVARSRFERCLVQHVTGHGGISLDEPIRTITAKDQWIVVDGDQYRPLTMREYARGMGFADTYTWPAGLARWQIVRGFGNAVPPAMARAAIEQVLS